MRETERCKLMALLKHDPEKACPGLDPGCAAVFGKDHASNKKLERDDDSTKSHPALGGAAASSMFWPLEVYARSRLAVIGWVDMRPAPASVPP